MPRRPLLPRPLRLHSDEGLVALARIGNVAAFEHLVRRYRVRLLAYCRQMVRSEADAEDLLQEIFVAAHGAIHRDERDIHVRPWLYRVARNQCLNHLRSARSAKANGGERDWAAELDAQPSPATGSVVERVSSREDFQHMVEDIQRLPETQSAALVLRELHGLTYTEVADAMGTTVGGVKSLLVRARVSLVEAAEGRALTCDDVRHSLAEASAEGTRRLGAPIRSHVKACDDCTHFKLRLRSTNKTLAALAPVWPLLALKGLILGKLGSGATSAGTAAAAGAGGSAIGVSSGSAALLLKTAVGLATVTAVATGVPQMGGLREQEPSSGAAITQPAPSAERTVAPPPVDPPARAPIREPGAGKPALGQEPAVDAPPARIVSTTPDVVPGVSREALPEPVDRYAPAPRTRPVPDEVALERARPLPGAPDQTSPDQTSADSQPEPAPAEPQSDAAPTEAAPGPE